MRTRWLVLLAAGMLSGAVGCINVQTPREINVGTSRPEPVDSSRVPHPQTLAEAQTELDRAYANLQYLERRNAELDNKASKYKRERDACRDRLDKYEDD